MQVYVLQDERLRYNNTTMWQKLKHLFIPCEGNTYKPHFLERFSMSLMLFLILLTFAVSNIQALLWVSSDFLVSTVLPAVIVELTNEERGSDALVTLRRNSLLDTAATLKAQDMANNEYFAHYSPKGISPWYWFDFAGYDYLHAGENLAVHFTDSTDVVEAWMKSPTHRANIMNGIYTEIGVGTAKGVYKGAPTVFVVQLFGSPRAHSETTETSTEVVTAQNNSVGDTVTTVAPPTAVLAQQTTRDVTESTETFEMIPAHDMVENTLVMYSETVSTTREGALASLENVEEHTAPASSFGKTVIKPEMLMRIIYSILAFIVICSLLVSIIVEWRRQNLLQIAYSSGLLVIMAVLFHVHTTLTSGVSII